VGDLSKRLISHERQEAKHMVRTINQDPLTPNPVTTAADYFETIDCDTDLPEG
jgi:hypothetical protein